MLKLIIIITSCLSLDNSDPCNYSVGKIFKEAKIFHDSVVNAYLAGQDVLKPRVSSYSQFAQFDFKNFIPINGKIDGKIDSAGYFEVGYSATGTITEINRYENKPNLNNWRMILYHTEDFIIIGVEDWTTNYRREGTSYDFLPGFLVYLKRSHKMFFINTYRFATLQFKPIFPMFELEDISYVAQINSNLQMTRLYRFIDGKISFFSEIDLYGDNRRIIHETVYEPSMKNFVLDEKSCIEDFEVYADNYKALSSNTVRKPCIARNNPGFPLWFFGGAHSYCD